MTHSAAIVIFTDIANDSAAVYRALGTAQEFVQAGDDVKIVFDGSGVDSIAAMTAEDNKLHGLLESLRDQVAGACGFCAKAHKSEDAIVAAGYPLLTDNNGHASIRNLVVEGRTVLTF
ncbi:DsrE/DsrF-like family protein [Paraoerskovia marina]|uniref:DsrE/DsrF-like family protein n=1 Tax=Paraoerskovia marina TaxID=545619 RepID=A0A1H1LUK9_9CELL|nr:DsrE family protein [Paraoerskovia marina]SDR77725.1 DsrE/DsrF-like family protein [Paraoerskovia marina]